MLSRRYDMSEQVLFDILLYLPVMSLLRFKAVCKYWISLIEGSTFISEHINRNRDNEEDNLIVWSRVFETNELGVEVLESRFALLSGKQYEECVYDIDDWQFWHPANEVHLTGYCDGVICLAHGKDTDLWNPVLKQLSPLPPIALWNPALKQLRPLPPPLFSNRFSDRLVSSEEECRFCSVYTSFGIDVKRNDYKVVRFLLVTSKEEGMVSNQVEVYNLGGDNSWRIVHKDDVLPFHEINQYGRISSGKSGMCFWLARSHDDNPILLSFDFSDHVFKKMLLPHGNHYRTFHSDLDLLDDKIVYMREIPGDYHNRNFDVWMLHEFGVKESWHIMYKIGPLTDIDVFYPLCISKSGEFLICIKSEFTVQGEELIAVKDDMIYLYNLLTQQGKYHQNCNLEIYLGLLVHYNASLLSLKNANNVRWTKQVN